MACFGVANDEILIRSTITPYSGALPSATRSDIPPILPQLHRPSSLAIPVPGIAGLVPIYREFFSQITHQPGPPLVPLEIVKG